MTEVFKDEYTDELLKEIFRKINEENKGNKIYDKKCPYCGSTELTGSHGTGRYTETIDGKEICYFNVMSLCNMLFCQSCNKNFSTCSWWVFGNQDYHTPTFVHRREVK